MSEHFLDAHDFGSVFEQVRREAVSQYVGLAFPSQPMLRSKSWMSFRKVRSPKGLPSSLRNT